MRRSGDGQQRMESATTLRNGRLNSVGGRLLRRRRTDVQREEAAVGSVARRRRGAEVPVVADVLVHCSRIARQFTAVSHSGREVGHGRGKVGNTCVGAAGVLSSLSSTRILMPDGLPRSRAVLVMAGRAELFPKDESPCRTAAQVEHTPSRLPGRSHPDGTVSAHQTAYQQHAGAIAPDRRPLRTRVTVPHGTEAAAVVEMLMSMSLAACIAYAARSRPFDSLRLPAWTRPTPLPTHQHHHGGHPDGHDCCHSQ